MRQAYEVGGQGHSGNRCAGKDTSRRLGGRGSQESGTKLGSRDDSGRGQGHF